MMAVILYERTGRICLVEAVTKSSPERLITMEPGGVTPVPR